MLWDTAGQEEFDAITKAYYRGAQAAVLAFSTVDRVSFDAIRSWKKKVRVVPFFFLFLFWLRVEMMSLGWIKGGNISIIIMNIISNIQ
jgi:hypothetical protein